MKRMKTVLVLLVICGVAACQSYIDFRKPMRLLYGGDTLIISLQGDSVIFSGEAAELVLRDSTLLEIIQEHGGTGGGGVTPTDNILQWDSVNNYYKPYASAPVGLGFYTSSQIPSSYKGDMGFNGSLFAYRVEANQVNASSNNDDTYAGRFTQTINSPGVLIQQSGNTALSSTRSTLRLERSVSGSSNIQSNIIDIVDNPTTSGQIIGSVLKAEIASTLRLNLNPRAENLSLSTAYLFDTHNNLTDVASRLMSVKNQGVEKFFVSTNETGVNNYLVVKDSAYWKGYAPKTRYAYPYIDSLNENVMKIDSTILGAGYGLKMKLLNFRKLLKEQVNGEIAWPISETESTHRPDTLLMNARENTQTAMIEQLVKKTVQLETIIYCLIGFLILLCVIIYKMK